MFRGHLGGLLGGALAAYLLGPNLIRNPGSKKDLVDAPPIRLFRYKALPQG